MGLVLAPVYFEGHIGDSGWPDDPAASSKALFAVKRFVSKIDADPVEIFRQVVGAYAPMRRSIEKSWENQRPPDTSAEEATA